MILEKVKILKKRRTRREVIVMDRVMIELSFMEMGYLYASLKEDCWDRMPRRLWLKLNIATTKAYIKHPTFGKQASKDIKKWQKELAKGK